MLWFSVRVPQHLERFAVKLYSSRMVGSARESKEPAPAAEREAANRDLAVLERAARTLRDRFGWAEMTLPERVRVNVDTTTMPGRVLCTSEIVPLEELLSARHRQIEQIDEAADLLAQVERTMRCITVSVLKPAAERGAVHINAPKLPRADGLARLIDQALAALPANATADQIQDQCLVIDGGDMIQEINPDDRAIFWRWRGRERTTTFKSFRNRITDRRKKISEPPIPG